MMDWLHEMVRALRSLAKRPTFAAAMIATVAIAIGAQSAAFGVVSGVLLDPLPFPDSEELVGLWYDLPGGPGRSRQSKGTFVLVQERNRVFSDVAIARRRSMTLEIDGQPRRIEATEVSPSLFPVLGIAPVAGRAFRDGDSQPGAEPTAMLSEEFWEEGFGADPSVVGRDVRIEGVTRRVVGVFPASVTYPTPGAQAWVPTLLDRANPDNTAFFFEGIGRLRDGETVESASAEIERLIRVIPEVYPDLVPVSAVENGLVRGIVLPLREQVVGDVGTTLGILFGAITILLVLAVSNVTNLYLVRLEGRRRELAVRAALGAGRSRLILHQMSEALVLSTVGGGLGLIIAYGALGALQRLGPSVVPRSESLQLDLPVVMFAVVLTLLVGVAIGGLGLRSMRAEGTDSTLKAGARNLGGRQNARIRWTLVVAQVSTATMLLLAGGVLLKSLKQLERADPGFSPEGVLGVRLALDEGRYPDNEGVANFRRALLEGVEALPGVTSVAATSFLPLRDGRVFLTWQAENDPPGPGELPASILSKAVTDGYFETLGITLVAGRTLRSDDLEASATPVAVVNERLAAELWPGLSAVGRRMSRTGGSPPWYEVVGVVRGVRDRVLSEPAPAIAYVPFPGGSATVTGVDPRVFSLAVRTAVPMTLGPAVQSVVRSLDSSVPLFAVGPLSEAVRAASSRQRIVTLLVGATALGGFLLGMVGLYGVITYTVEDRRREIGLRIALGALGSDVVRREVFRSLSVAAGAMGIGVAGYLAASRVLATVLFAITPYQPGIIASVLLVLAASAGLAAWYPARRAAALNPMDALAAE